MSLTLALSKGRLLEKSTALLRRAGVPVPAGESRKLVATFDGYRVLFVKDLDVPTYVEYGVADCGIVGSDVLREVGSDVYQPLDLGFGRCRLVVARRKGSGVDYHSTVRVATKYSRLATAHFLERGVSAEVVKLAGSVEIAPGLGLADCVVDIVETGRTLEANGLEVVEEVAASSACLIVNRASFHARREEVSRLVSALEKAR